ncbi:MAG TPA: IPT/TIG domain-containing protein, partial [Baekduia sp.]|nr:IPT/TIG domain-containing protein [Baekduia sp.]
MSSKTAYPTVASIAPRKLTIGDKLTIKGSNFLARKSSVAFYKSGKPVIFVKADSATSTRVVVTIPSKVADLLGTPNGVARPTLLRLRVIGARMGKTWTKNSRSPIVSPLPPVPLAPGTDPSSPASQQQAAAIAYQSCQQQAAADPTGDRDADGLNNTTESAYKLDPCIADTDLDGMIDGYEFFSAIDLNGSAIPYPGTRPWPNPLDPTDT